MPHPPLSPFRRAFLWGLTTLLVHAPLASQPSVEASRAPTFDAVVTALEAGYHDATFRTSELPRLAAELRPRAVQAASPAEERAVTWELLSQVPASHLALISSTGRAMLENELFNRPRPTLGFQLVRWEGRYFATMVLPGGPAAAAGIRPWDEITSIDGFSPERSSRLDWRTDDAFLVDDRDPPVHAVLVREDETVRLGVAARPGAAREIEVPVRAWSALQGARASVRSVVRDDVRIGYVRLFYLHITEVPELLEAALDGPLAESEALVLDLRGRGGGAHVVQQVLQLLTDGPKRRFRGPVVALIDRQARSGKEVLAYEMRRRGVARLVGEPTAGAVIPASFVDLGAGAVLMFPRMRLPTYTDLLEGKPTPPDVAVAWGGPYSGDRDPILEAGLDEAVRMAHADGRGTVLRRASAATTIPRRGNRGVPRPGPGVRARPSAEMLAP
jgi:C-terminal processing protease CtpA/Prc